MTPPRPLGAQVLAATAATVGTCAVLGAAWFVGSPGARGHVDGSTAPLLAGLVAGLIVAYHYPIHVDKSSRVYASGVVLFLMAVLVPPALAATSIAAGILAGEVSTFGRTGNHRFPAIIPTQVARWSVVGLAASLVAHVASHYVLLPLLGAAAVMWSGDILTGPLLLSPVLHRSPMRVIRMMVREGGLYEGTQYLIGVLGALAAAHQAWAILLLAPPTALVYLAFKRATERGLQSRSALEAIADMVDLRDGYAAGHSRRVAELTQSMVSAMGENGPEVDVIVCAARLHDIGKIGVSDEILRKPGPLSPSERAMVSSHSDRGADLLARHPDVRGSARIVRHHHERWDGGGYPDHLKGSEIPFGARIVAVAESYDSMTHDSSYRLRMPPTEAVAVLRLGRGTQWDPDAVDALAAVLGEEILAAGSRRLSLVPDGEARDV